MEPEDISEILDIDRKISGQSRAMTYTNLFRETMGGEIGVSYVAEDSDKMVGFVLAHLTFVRETITEACVIQIFGVDPDYQRKGVARQLFHKLLEECRAKGIKSVRVMVAEKDAPLRTFFEHIGFTRAQYIGYNMTP
jgi:GNAT superfamily N-acetyltransferase